jgi:hypothetical protein
MIFPEHGDRQIRRGPFRVLDLVGPSGTFLRRRGIDLRLFGVYLHRIDQADPGLDLHDHPWPFVSIVLRGGYQEEHADAREAATSAASAEGRDVWHDGERILEAWRGAPRFWGRWSIHRIRMTEAHRITAALPGTTTLLLRGRKTRAWGFFIPDGYVDQREYDYARRRPATEVRR